MLVRQSTSLTKHKLAITAGEPAGIGPDILIQIAQRETKANIIVIASPELLEERASQLGLPIELVAAKSGTKLVPKAGRLYFIEQQLSAPVCAGTIEPENAKYVLECIKTAVAGCISGEFAAMVTAPVNKAVINDAGYKFTGHTEFIADLCNCANPVMLLANENLRVALATTHLPLASVPTAITFQSLEQVIQTVYEELQDKFALRNPHLLICGLNPHAGEQGHLGSEEIEIIEPVLEKLRKSGMHLTGPSPADTAFTPSSLTSIDAVVAMYHDQGLPALKAQGFGEIVNVTLGLPIIRTSVDHGTALELAGTGKANPNSMLTAIEYATRIVNSTK